MWTGDLHVEVAGIEVVFKAVRLGRVTSEVCVRLQTLGWLWATPALRGRQGEVG